IGLLVGCVADGKDHRLVDARLRRLAKDPLRIVVGRPRIGRACVLTVVESPAGMTMYVDDEPLSARLVWPGRRRVGNDAPAKRQSTLHKFTPIHGHSNASNP